MRRRDEFAHYGGASWLSLVSAPTPDHKIPEWEQQLSCGAAGMNLLLAAHALGFVAGWVTGWYAYSEQWPARSAGRESESPASSSLVMPRVNSRSDPDRSSGKCGSHGHLRNLKPVGD